VKLRIPVVTLVAFALSAPAASADTSYGGAAVKDGRQIGPAIGLVARDNGTVTARVTFTYSCRRTKVLVYNVAVRLKGNNNAGSFILNGRTRPGRRSGLVRLRLIGKLTPDAVTGSIRLRNRCGNSTHAVLLRSATTPAGAAAAPPRNTLFYGLTNHLAGGVLTPVVLRVAGNGRVYANTYTTARCDGRFTWPVSNSTAPTTVKADGTFQRNERFTVRYRDGSTERYRVSFGGRFLADGATGTLRVRLVYRDGRARYSCDTGPQTWTARP
jgi:hypothetical protein